MSLSPVTSSQSPKGGGKMKAPRNTGHYSLKDREVEEEEVRVSSFFTVQLS